MATVWICKFARQAGRHLSNCPSPPRGDFAERLAQLLWSLERIEQKRAAAGARGHVLKSMDTLN